MSWTIPIIAYTKLPPPTLAKNVNEEEKQGNNSQDHDAKD
jgi:hypothetical protein